MSEYVTVVNRTSKPLKSTWDGKISVLTPGKHSLPRIIAEAARRQNPVMGSEDPYTLTMQYLVGIEEDGDPIDPIEQTQEIEKMNRKLLKGSKPVDVVPGDNGIYSARDIKTNLPLDSSFVKP